MILGVLLVASASPAAAAAPDLATCPHAETREGWERERTRPLPVPEALRDVVKADLLHLAVFTLRGATVCVETSWMETAEDIALTPDRRFLSFRWIGYESYGHVMVDRTGRGEAIETGVAPVFSPSRRYFAAADQTESEFGSLSGLAVWRVDAEGTAEVGRISELPRMHDWRVDGWAGENCIALSAVPLDLPPEGAGKQERIRYRAAPDRGGWRITREPGGCSATKR